MIKKTLEEAVSKSIETKRISLIIEDDYWFFGVISDYLHKYNIKCERNISKGEIVLENESRFIFKKHSTDSMLSQGGYEYHYVLISESLPLSSFEYDYYERRERLNI